MPEAVALVIPCYNEAARLDVAAFAALAESRPGLRLLFVDDGSIDGTAEVLERLRAARPEAVEVLRLSPNGGKAEAVRRGLAAALEGGARIVGYADADLATPPGELLRMIADLEARPVGVLLGSRVRLLGTRIERRALRHYLGRLFATIASLALGIPVYDTQCGAKLFLATDALRGALADPFRTRWVFDVELLDRLLRGNGGGALAPVDMRELPLREWRDVGGSSLRAGAMLRAGMQLLSLALRSRAARARARRKGRAGVSGGLA
jgi:glycosyltransferase involved in cell wall biosynthesis